MPPLNAGAASGQTPGHGRGAPTATALAGVARHKLALHLPADATFRHELENKLHLQPFRGIVTAVARDSSGTNNVSIKRTGQLHADPSPYPVFASKLIPIVGDEVLLEYVAGSPTAMVTQARKGGRPDEQDVPWSGGSLRRFDSVRALLQKHRDDHNLAHYRADGATVAHVTGENGDQQHVGDHYHNVGTLTESAGKSGGYHRKTHNASAGQYEHHHNDGLATRRLRAHDYTTGQKIYNGAALGADAIAHVHHVSGEHRHTGNHYQNAGAIATNGTISGGFHLKGHIGGQYEHHHSDGAVERRLRSHDYVNGHKMYSGALGSDVIVHHHHPGGDFKQLGDQYQNVQVIANDGTPSGQYHRKAHIAGRYEHHRFEGGADYLLRHHDKGGDHGFYAQGSLFVNHVNAGNGAKTRHAQHGSSYTRFHEQGDDGTGNHQATHASGVVMVTHAGTSVTHRVSAGRVLTHDGTNLTHFGVGDRPALTHTNGQLWIGAQVSGAVFNDAIAHNGATHTISTGGRAVIQHTNSGLGGKMLAMSTVTNAPHQIGDTGAGDLNHQSNSGTLYLSMNAGGSAHLFDGNQHKLPSTTTLRSLDSSRIDTLSGTGGGALKAPSHSIAGGGTGVKSAYGPISISSVGGVFGANTSAIAPSGGGISAANQFFKMQSVMCYNGTYPSTPKWQHGDGWYDTTHSSWWASTNLFNGAPDANGHFFTTENSADGSMTVYASNGSTATTYNLEVLTQMLNV